MGCGASSGKKYEAGEPVPAPNPAPAANETGGEEDNDIEDEEEIDDHDVEAILEAVDLDVNQAVSRKEWIAIMSEMSIDRSEAGHLYDQIARDCADEGIDVEEGVPLKEFLEELRIEIDDLGTLRNIAKAAEAARKKLEAGEVEAEDEAQEVDMRALEPGIDKVVRALDLQGRPAEDTWAIMEEGKVPLSASQKAAIDTFEEKREELVEKVKECMLQPPMINSSGGQNACRELCTAEIDRIIAACEAEGTQFTDPDWDMTSMPQAVLYVDKEKPGWDCTVGEPAGYKRLTELIESPQLFKGGIRAGDIIQGQIGTCFLLGAIGAMVSRDPKAVKKLFIKYDIKVGVYGVRFNLDGEWTYVIVDDWMPINQYGGLLYARSNDPEEVWCPLLEKAFCKLHTCYEMCDGGHADEAIFNFFGGVSGDIKVTDEHRADPVKFWQAVKVARQHGYMLTTHFRPKETAAGAEGKCGEDTFESGLVGGHCYSVLKAVEASDEHLICIRNPWGAGEWQGKWSDKNEQGEWTDEMKEACGYTGENDGKFWMSVQDFIENSPGISFARPFGPDWQKITQYKHFQKSAMLATAKYTFEARVDHELSIEKGDTVRVKSFAGGWWSGAKVGDEEKEGYFPSNYVVLKERPVARFDLQGTKNDGVEGPMTSIVMLMQPDTSLARRFYTRKEDGMNYKDTKYPAVKLVVINPDGKVQLKKVGKKRCIWGELKMPGGGLWRIYALSTDGLGGAFSLRVYVKDGAATLTEKPGADIKELKEALRS